MVLVSTLLVIRTTVGPLVLHAQLVLDVRTLLVLTPRVMMRIVRLSDML